MLRRLLLAAADSDRLRRLASDLPAARAVARRFVAGERLDDALAVTRDLNERGLRVSLDELGEAVTDVDLAERAAASYVATLDAVAAHDLDASISVKATQLGLDVSFDLAARLVARVCERAAEIGTHVTIDMEGSDHTQATVDLLVKLRADGHDNVGCAAQSYLHRTLDDVRHLTGMGASLRICKGAYAEPDDIAYQDRREVSDSFVRCAEIALRSDTYGRFATHDHRVIAKVRNLARRHQRRPDADYELQMLYGVREPLQARLAAAGEGVRIYVPFGHQWYPYLTRRLAERPANLAFFLRALAGPRS